MRHGHAHLAHIGALTVVVMLLALAFGLVYAVLAALVRTVWHVVRRIVRGAQQPSREPGGQGPDRREARVRAQLQREGFRAPDIERVVTGWLLFPAVERVRPTRSKPPGSPPVPPTARSRSHGCP